MALVKPVIFQVVGYQNSGKTTFLLSLIQILTEQGYRVMTIKHHGHGGKPEGTPQKDSSRHLKAGASASIVEGDGSMILQANAISWSLEEQISLMECLQPEILLIEGHKHESYPKLILIKSDADLPLLSKLDHIKAVICWEKELFAVSQTLKVPFFHISDKNAVFQIAEKIKQYVQKDD
ncbi:molybdopterin-guanine dinucleotide biosynthesis protein B [Bacillus sp. MRMR6]|uniref:molybdopterin-guanine dinucleotide biosynthesis protein B n=1 Tax=Bacillus sp. MRMR6 TaxID=1928617 RepID=UPI0009528277|nr:molybdopterin-guanine dinucleotide biosynthesis protein B [Bacillus sp. MRMR6]OLS36517.1 molybdopterin-guanine dinucleotide biosynthesis protein B [Bacillus sp. MRMR6]